MAVLRIPDEDRVLTEPDAIRDHLRPHGIEHERWQVAGRLVGEATAEEVLAAFAPEVAALQARGGYVAADVIQVTPDLPGLQAMLDKFNREHRHAEDEVRFIISGRGVFHIHPDDGGPVFAIEVGEGDLINVPAGTRHWFDLCAERSIRAIRLFKDKAGWAPLYTGDDVAAGYQPLCFGPGPRAGGEIRIEPVLKPGA